MESLLQSVLAHITNMGLLCCSNIRRSLILWVVMSPRVHQRNNQSRVQLEKNDSESSKTSGSGSNVEDAASSEKVDAEEGRLFTV
jgi:hypothetical protein